MTLSNQVANVGLFFRPSARLAVAAGAWVACVQAASAAAPAFADEVAAFTDRHCSSCHNDVDKEGGLDLTSLAYKPADAANFATWVKVHDRVQNGEMPPKEKKRPEASAMSAFLRTLSTTLVASEKEVIAANGRAMRRRMNRSEYEDALRDILNAPWVDVKAQLPEDGEAFRFNKVSTALDVSHVHMARYMAAADYALRQAMSVKLTQPPTTLKRYYAREVIPYVATNGNADRGRFPILNSEADPDALLWKRPLISPAGDPRREEEAVAWTSSSYVVGFNVNLVTTRGDSPSNSNGFWAPVAGRYKVRFSGYSIWVGPEGSRWPTYAHLGYTNATAPGGNAGRMTVVPPEWHRPNYFDISAGRVTEPITVYAKGGSTNRLLGGFDVTPEVGVQEFGEVWLGAREYLMIDSARYMRSRPGVTKIDSYTNPLARRDGMPGVALRWYEVEGPFYDEKSTAGYNLLFGDLPIKRVDAAAKGSVAINVINYDPPARGGARAGGRAGAAGAAGGGGLAGGGFGGPGQNEPQPIPDNASLQLIAAFNSRGSPSNNIYGGPIPQLTPVQVDVESANPMQDAERLLRGFMARVYRRPVEEGDVKMFLGLIKDRMADGTGFAGSMLAGYTAVLSSPKFLFLDEKPGRLDDRALATRLALFLWNSEPDAELRARAERGELGSPQALKKEVERMLSDSRSDRFVDRFLDYWLELRRIEDTTPSSTMYSDFYLDESIVEASVAEPRLFFKELVSKNLPARNIVDSDFTFMNGRLAALYEMPEIVGWETRRVALPKDSIRGGVMTMAAVLKVTANGTTTSPVLRGKWLAERIMGYEIPPPPAAVPAVEPDIRGAATIRQQLDKHRADESCAMCHRKIDPPGFALESFDVMGGFRERYRAESKLVPAAFGNGHNGWPFVFHFAQQVDPSGQLPDGRQFKDVRDFKQLLLADEPQIVRNLVRQLSVYATGAPVRFADRAEIEKIVTATAPSQHGVRSIIHELVQSDLFRNK